MLNFQIIIPLLHYIYFVYILSLEYFIQGFSMYKLYTIFISPILFLYLLYTKNFVYYLASI